ncbi:Ig-like domain-containing protein, partial [Mycolicibacterium sp. P9-64]|uniref:Ig-like domain-containing protein n=1 Tax=Mycolicibacterium sp. P9-64 TaxID=2024612 RepID=UPI0015641B22
MALGVGAAVATGHGLGLPQAHAEPGSDPSGTKSSDSPSESGSTATSSGQTGEGHQTTTEPATETSTSTTTTGSTSQPTHAADSAPEMQVSSSGGANTSTNDQGQATDHDPTPTPTPSPSTTHEQVGPTTTPTVTTPVTQVVEQPPEVPATTPTAEASAAGNTEAVAPEAVHDVTTSTGSDGGSDPSKNTDSTPTAPKPNDHIQSMQTATSGADDISPVAAHESPTANSMQFAALSLPQPPPDSSQQVHPLLAIPAAIVNIAATFVAAIFAPFLAPGPAAPAQPPLLWAVLAWVRREIQHTFFNRTPHVQSQDVDLTLGPGEVSQPISFGGYDSDGDSIVYGVPARGALNGPTHGTVAVDEATGTFTYNPDDGYTGTDEFTVTVSDAENCLHFHGLLGFLRPNFGHTDTATIRLTINAPTGPGVAPVAHDDTVNAIEDHSATGNVLSNDTNAGSGPLTAALGTGPTHGTLALGSDGSFTYTPQANYTGADSFTYTASDGTSTSNLATVTIGMTAVNDAPVAGDDAVNTSEDSPVSGNVLTNDTDVDSSSLTVVNPGTITTTHGTVALAADGTFTYTPTANFSGTDLFSYQTTDGQAVSRLAIVTITITAVNDAPMAGNDAVTTTEDHQVSGNVLTNDTDVDSSLTVVNPGTITTTHGTVTLASDGSFTYTPTANYFGTDSFTYRATDGQALSDLATVTITVVAINDAPVAGDDAVYTSEDSPVSGNVLTNDTDVDSGTLTVVNPGTITTTHGTVALAADGSFTYTPTANFSGTDLFSYQTTDGQAVSRLAIVTITIAAVNDAPVAGNDAVTTTEDHQVSGNVLTNDTDVDSSSLTVVNPGTITTTHGTVTLAADGSFAYTPTANYFGTDSFTYQSTDGQAVSDLATVTITITAVNDAPVASDDAVNTSEDSPVSGNVLTNDTDIDSSTLTVVSPGTIMTDHGTVTLAADGSFTYTPVANYNGTDSFTYQATDGTTVSALATVTITITAVNDAPVAGDDTVNTSEDTPVSGNVLTNDTDVESSTLTVVNPGIITTTHGTVTLAADGSFTYTPVSHYNGTDSFTYQATDGTTVSAPATVTITVTAVNDAPVAGDDGVSTTEDNPASGNVLTNDTDIDSSTITVANPGTITTTHGTVTLAADGSFTYTPVANYNGTDSFTYQATDGTTVSDLATVTITITAVNDAPVSVGDTATNHEDTSVTGNVLTNDTDIDSGTLTVVSPGTITTTHGTVTLAADGSFTYTPQSNYNGTDSFTYQATDGTTISDLATVTITITAVNDTPAAGDDTATTNEDTPVSGNVLTNDTDIDSSTVTVANPGTITTDHGTVTLAADGSFTYTPTANFFGTDSFTYRATDGTTISDLATVTITITAVNDTPVAGDDTATTNEDTPVSGNVLTNDTDIDSSTVTVANPGTITTTHGTVTLAADGSFTYKPVANYN